MKILSENNPEDIFLKAASMINDAVAHTIGPNGTNTAVQGFDSCYNIINDGKSILECLGSDDPEILTALETLKQASFETNRKAGDGTTTTAIMTYNLLKSCLAYIKANNLNAVEVRRNLEQYRDQLIEIIDSLKREITEADYEDVATVSLGSDKYAKLVSDAYRFLDKGQRPILLKTDSEKIETEEYNGLVLTKTQVPSAYFLDAGECSNFKILSLYQTVGRWSDFAQLLRQVISTKTKVLLLYNELSVEVIQNLQYNYTNGTAQIIPIKVGTYGKDTYRLMQTIEEYTGASIIDGTNLKLNEPSKFNFGNVEYAVLSKDNLLLKSNKKISRKVFTIAY